MYVEVVKAFNKRRSLKAWEISEESSSIQMIVAHILYHLRAYLREEELFENERHIAENKLLRKLRVTLTVPNAYPVLDAGCTGAEIFLEK